jgi:uncharacterized membrane protein YidH (DUF202 family)
VNLNKSPRGRLNFDLLISFGASIVISILLGYFGKLSSVISSISSFNLTITTVLGILFTVLTILYTFESQFEDNRAVREMRRNGTYQNILEIFFLSVSVIGLVWIYTFSLTVFQIYSGFGWCLKSLLSGFEIWGFSLLLVRLGRCYEIFWLLNRAMREN